MTRILTKLCGGVLAVTFLAAAPAPTMALPLVAPDLAAGANSNVIDVRHGGPHKEIRRGHRPPGHAGNRPNHRPPNWNGGHRPPNWNGGHRPGYRPPGYRPGYWNGYHGYQYARPGYRYYDGWWYPLAAFGVGAAIGSMAAQPSYNYNSYGGGYSASHYQWCENRYRSYRASDNTFQPNNGPRRQCTSPYG